MRLAAKPRRRASYGDRDRGRGRRLLQERSIALPRLGRAVVHGARSRLERGLAVMMAAVTPTLVLLL